MPLYEYACEACGHHLEAQQKMADAALCTCPSCGKDELQRLISATSFVLKGSGWYKDGYSGKTGKERTDNQRTDRLEKAINDDKKKTGGGTGGTGGTSGGTGGSSDSGSGSSSPASSSGTGGTSGSGSAGGSQSTAAA